MEFSFSPIAYITSCYPEKFGTPRQGALAPGSWGVIDLEPWIQPELAVRGLEGFSHIWVIYVFHLNQNKQVKAMVRPPRLEGDKIGVLATRSPHHPNPIGLTCARLDGIEGRRLKVSGIDLVSGTPILDIKPYLPQADFFPLARGGWADLGAAKGLSVCWSDLALKDLESLAPEHREAFQTLAEETIRLDPRPVCYRENQATEAPYGNRFGIALENKNILLEIRAGTAEILRVEPLPKTPK